MVASASLDTRFPTRVAIPAELTSLNHWVAAGPDKIPINVATNRRATVDRPDTWSTYDQASVFTAPRLGWYPGFVLTTEDGIVCIDLDHCRNPKTGEILPWAAATIERFRPVAYIEISRSGTGIHIFIKATLPPGRRKNGQVEVYDHRRFIVVTQNVLSVAPLLDGTDELIAFHQEHFAESPAAPPDVPGLTGQDRDVLHRAFGAANGAKVRKLWHGSDAGYRSPSEADAALVACLAYYTNDPAQLERLLLASGRWRPKLQRADYRQRTIEQALALQNHPLPSVADGAVDSEPSQVDALRAQVRRLQQRVTQLEEQGRQHDAVHLRTLAVLRNPHLKTVARTAVALAYYLQCAQSRDATDASGWTVVPRAALAEWSGSSLQAVGDHLKALARWGLIHKASPYEGGKRVLRVRSTRPIPELMETLASFVPPEGTTWGGKRRRTKGQDDSKTIPPPVCVPVTRIGHLDAKDLAPMSEPTSLVARVQQGRNSGTDDRSRDAS